jgi:hypothetical protein
MDVKNEIILYQKGNNSEIITYQPDEYIKLEVVLEDETVWLSQTQMSELFQTTRSNINIHIANIYREGELDREVSCKDSLHITQHGAIKGKTKEVITKIYNLDVIISVSYRVKSQQGTLFRMWATRILKEFLFRGYVFNQHLAQIDSKLAQHDQKLIEQQKQIDFIIKTEIPPKEGIFYSGQIFDAYIFVADLIKSAKNRIIVIDNYADDSVLTVLSKRNNNVKATIFTNDFTKTLQLDLQKHNEQYRNQKIAVKVYKNIHDRFIIIDNEIYHLGASMKDLGKKLFAFTKMEVPVDEFMKKL